MKRILITGVNSYVGNNLKNWLEKHSEKYHIEQISLRNDDWREEDLSRFDVVVHVAGIAHQKETKENVSLYYKVNRDLTVEIATKSKNEGVTHFLFFSTMSVYGLDEGVIDENTPLKPKTHYGKSKLEAEQLIKPLADEYFKIAIIRPPMIYGKNCPGNYQRLAKLATKTPVFPNIRNKRSMIYIDNLSEFIRILIDGQKDGLFLPQNKEFICTTELVRLIATEHNKNIYFTKLFNPILKMIKTSTVQKVFGDLIYKQNISQLENKYNYNIVDMKQSVVLTESMESSGL